MLVVVLIICFKKFLISVIYCKVFVGNISFVVEFFFLKNFENWLLYI